jgi:glycosyltransferase involved in cell wall biosynthesis
VSTDNPPSPAAAAPGLGERLAAVAAVLLPGAPTAADPGDLLVDLVREVAVDLALDRVWLLWSAVAAAFPTSDEVREAARAIELDSPDAAAVELLRQCFAAGAIGGATDRRIRIATGEVVIDVDFSARHNVHTGIQRVVRSTLPHWQATHGRPAADSPELTYVAWTPAHTALRTLDEDERLRVLRWTQWRSGLREVTGGAHSTTGDWELVIPWRSVVVIPEVPVRAVCSRLAALAELSANRVVAIGYDCIPVVSADLVPANEPNRFVQYLAAIKHVHRVAGISVSATAEFAGFAQMLATQGLAGPQVFECLLPAVIPDVLPDAEASPLPLVLCIGSFEPRKNQSAVLYAAEQLWREGLRFELRFVGGGGVSRAFPRQVHRLATEGNPVRIATGITDAELESAYTQARFTVFTSVHEGYGLPIAESLAHGTPVITSDYGSMREVAAAGGTVLIDPRDDRALIDAMHTLLVDDAVVARLREQIAQRPHRGWDDYAAQLWDGLVEPELGALGGSR